MPEGGVGKSGAGWTGAARATGEVLVFLDADVRLADDGLERLLGERERRGGLVTVQPYHAVGSLVERLSAVCNIVVMGALGACTPLGERVRSAGGFGPCLVVSRRDYRACGGHRAVRGLVVEDMAFADAARRCGLPVACLAGRGSATFRMYPEGLPSMVEGWSKGMAAGSGRTPLLARALMIAWRVGATTGVILLAEGVAALAVAGRQGAGSAASGEAAFGIVAVAAYLAYAAQTWWMLRRIGSFGPATALAYPLPLAFFHAVFARSLWLAKVRGSVTWRGRRVSVRPPRRRDGAGEVSRPPRRRDGAGRDGAAART